jgi:hypothetical protein
MKLSHFSNSKPDAGSVLKRTMPLFAAMALVLATNSASAQTVLPPDADLDIDNKTCQVAPDQFKSWFKNNAVEKDGVVKPADSLHFVASSECAFYKWSAQMFLWLTSPVSPGRSVFNSDDFFAVSAPVAGTPPGQPNRKLIRQNVPEQRGFTASIALQPNIPKVVTDSTGKKRPVVTLETASGLVSPFLDKANKPVEVSNVAATQDGKPILLDRFNKAIDFKKAANGAPAISGPSASTVKLAATTVLIGNEQRLQTINGAVVVTGGTETNQATGDVLLTKKEGVVLYLIQVNDVFAYFKIGVGKNAIPAPEQLPSEESAVAATEAFASTVPPPDKKQSFGNRKALALELKSSWVDLETLPTEVRGDYLTIDAVFPRYETTGGARRKQTEVKPGKLALVGFHVVGTTQGHPEMIWATFEHVNNAPNASYSYQKATGQPGNRDKDGDANGAWLFSASAATEPGNAELIGTARMNGIDIVAKPNQTIAPVNVTRRFPWGSDAGDAATNTKIIAVNTSVTGQLANDDLRKKYLLVGALWTNGLGPDESKPNEPPVPQRGTKAVANSTMETFSQKRNCFVCHGGDRLGVSHIWEKIIPAFP